MSSYTSRFRFLLMFLHVVNVLIVAFAGFLMFGIIFLAGANSLMMIAPIGIVSFTGVAFSLSIKWKKGSLISAIGIAALPMCFAPIWYELTYKVVESKCKGWTCTSLF